jgi:hypothetical protein
MSMTPPQPASLHASAPGKGKRRGKIDLSLSPEAAREAAWARFAAGEIDVFEAINALDHASALTADGRKADGVVYTPPSLARSMCAMLDPDPAARVLEPSCGRGVFVFSILHHQKERHGWSWSQAARWAEAHLFASELDAQALADLARLWTIHFDRHGVASDLSDNLRAGDALFGGFSAERFGAVLGNPPYVRIQNLPDATRLAIQARFSSCAKGNVDLFYAFCQQALEIAERVCFVVPNSLFSNNSAKALRAQLAPRLRCAIDFGARLVFAPVRAYSCVFLAEPADARGPLAFWRNNLPEEGGKWLAVPAARLLSRADRYAFLHAGHSPAAERLGLVHPHHAHEREQAHGEGDAHGHGAGHGGPAAHGQAHGRAGHAGSSHGHAAAHRTLGDVADVLSGIATLADGSYVLPAGQVVQNPQGGEAWAFADPATGAPRSIPLELCPRFLKLTKVRGAQEATDANGPRILCPYDAAWKVVPEKDLPPDALAWLLARKATLLGRDKGKTEGYEAWHAYGRRQGFCSFDPSDKLLLLAGMAHGPMSPIAVSGQDLAPRFLFASGFVVRPKDPDDADKVEAFLRSNACWSQILREGRAWAGGKDYRTFGARLLRTLRFS